MSDDEFAFKCDQCGKPIIGKPFYTNFVSYDDDDESAQYDICSAECLIKFTADKVFSILNKRK